MDKFKSVNDTYGHQVGDLVLVQTAQLLRRHIRSTDTLGRWGGEEFNFEVVGSKTASFGVSSYRQGDSEEQIIERADKALYRVKEGGRNRIEAEQ